MRVQEAEELFGPRPALVRVVMTITPAKEFEAAEKRNLKQLAVGEESR